MSPKKQLIAEPPFRPTEFRRLAPPKKWVTMRRYAAVMTLSVMLPALVPDIEFFGLHSARDTLLAFVLVGIFLKGFGVPFYLVLRWFLEQDANEIKRAPHLPARTNHGAFPMVPQTVFVGHEDLSQYHPVFT